MQNSKIEMIYWQNYFELFLHAHLDKVPKWAKIKDLTNLRQILSLLFENKQVWAKIFGETYQKQTRNISLLLIKWKFKNSFWRGK